MSANIWRILFRINKNSLGNLLFYCMLKRKIKIINIVCNKLNIKLRLPNLLFQRSQIKKLLIYKIQEFNNLYHFNINNSRYLYPKNIVVKSNDLNFKSTNNKYYY